MRSVAEQGKQEEYAIKQVGNRYYHEFLPYVVTSMKLA
jgi:hypothetical protein